MMFDNSSDIVARKTDVHRHMARNFHYASIAEYSEPGPDWSEVRWRTLPRATIRIIRYVRCSVMDIFHFSVHVCFPISIYLMSLS